MSPQKYLVISRDMKLTPRISNEVLELSDQRKPLVAIRKIDEDCKIRYDYLKTKIKKMSKKCKLKWIKTKFQVVEETAVSHAHKLLEIVNETCGV
jgi:hypothetical protein